MLHVKRFQVQNMEREKRFELASSASSVQQQALYLSLKSTGRKASRGNRQFLLVDSTASQSQTLRCSRSNASCLKGGCGG